MLSHRKTISNAVNAMKIITIESRTKLKNSYVLSILHDMGVIDEILLRVVRKSGLFVCLGFCLGFCFCFVTLLRNNGWFFLLLCLWLCLLCIYI